MVMIELSESEMPRPLPPPNFSSPFAAPSLRWACKKRLRCFHPDAPAALRPSSPSRSPSCRGPTCHDGRGSSQSASVAARPGSPLPPLSPATSDRPRFLIRVAVPRREDGGRDEDVEPLAMSPPPTDLPSTSPKETAGDEEGPRAGGEEAVGWCLRSRFRVGEEKGKKKRRVELWVPLSRDEVEEDFLRMTGSKAPRKCRRRGRTGSDNLKGIFPGSWLPNTITADRYKVAEPSNPRKG